MTKELKISQGIERGLIDKNVQLSSDTLERVNQVLNMIRTSCNVNILIQSDILLDKTRPIMWQCIIGRELDDYAEAQIFSNGLGDTIGDAMINSINEFIEYSGINRDLIKQ